MEPEIQKAVDAGKITAQAGKALSALKEGTFCLHKSWGFGRIASVNFLLNQVTIDFKAKKGHTMQLEYAAESLQPISEKHILARKASDVNAVKAEAKEKPVALVSSILSDLGGKATQDQIAQTLIPEVFSETEFKKWWDSTKKALKKDGHIGIPLKKTDPIELREQAVSRGDELLAAFTGARQLKQQLAALDQILKNTDAFSDPATQLGPVLKAIEQSARQGQKLHTDEAVELLIARDEISEKANIPVAPEAFGIAQLLSEEDRRFVEIISEVPASKQKRVLAEIPKAFGEKWTARVFMLLARSNNTRVVAEVARLLADQGKQEELRKEVDRSIRDHSITAETLYWICKERDGEAKDLVDARIFSASISALERDQFNDIKRGSKLRDLLMDDRELVVDLLANADEEAVRNAVRKLNLTPVVEELNKRSLLGRIIRVHPEMQSLLSGETKDEEKDKKPEVLMVSWESLEKRQLELEDLEKRKIPENIKEIEVARSYGDLRENFEFKAAKEMQRVLQRQKVELQMSLGRARGMSYDNPDTRQVSIGTTVALKNIETGAVQNYSVLGAWDSDPDHGVISYKTVVGQALIGRKVGEKIDLPNELGTEKVEVLTIEAYKQPATAS